MLHQITSRQFIAKLKTRNLENISVIKQIERSLLEQRKYIFRMPKRGSSVVLLLSGGLDSVTSWGILMKEFGLHVYPLSFNRGEKRAPREETSINYFSKFYQRRYPSLFHQPIRLSLGTQNITIPIEKATEKLHEAVILHHFTGDEKLASVNISLGSFLLLPIYAKLYAEYLQHTQNSCIRTIFCSVTTRDGLGVPHQTFTSLRAIMYYLCTSSRDYTWQFSSVAFEKENGLYYDKNDLVRWATDHNIPIEKTWSCYHAKRYQCGGTDCITCVARRDAFYLAGVQDQTIYHPIAEQSFLGAIKHDIHVVYKKMLILAKYSADICRKL